MSVLPLMARSRTEYKTAVLAMLKKAGYSRPGEELQWHGHIQTKKRKRVEKP